MTIRKSIFVLVVLIGSLSGWDLAQARSFGGNCSNWVVGNLTEINGTNREAETKAICASIRESGDFIAEYESRNKSCMLCALDDWTPIKKEPDGKTEPKVDGDASDSKGGAHSCADRTIPVSAKWKFYGAGGGGGAKYAERAGAVCFTTGYHTYSDNQWRTFVCDKGWVNCRLKKEVPITKIVDKGKYTGYHFGKGRNRASRTPTNQVKHGK